MRAMYEVEKLEKDVSVSRIMKWEICRYIRPFSSQLIVSSSTVEKELKIMCFKDVV